MKKSKVRKYIVNNLDEYMDMFIKKLIRNDIKYCEIKYPLYTEIHIEDKIYRFYSFSKIQSNNADDIASATIKNLSNFTQKKEKTGYKKYTKSLIKKENKKIKPNTKKR